MSSILKIRVPFKRRKTAGGVDGRATFYLESVPNYVPQVGQTVIITHTGVPANSPLATKLTNISTNTVTGVFQSVEQNTTQTSTCSYETSWVHQSCLILHKLVCLVWF